MAHIQLIITMDDQGQVSVNGPIQNQLLSFGLLEMAKTAISEHNKQQADKRVQLAPPGLAVPPVLPGGKS